VARTLSVRDLGVSDNGRMKPALCEASREATAQAETRFAKCCVRDRAGWSLRSTKAWRGREARSPSHCRPADN